VAKTIKVESSVRVLNAAQTVEGQSIIKEEVSVEEVTQVFPMKIAAMQVDVSLPFGGVAQAKRITLTTSQEVTLKINNLADIGFPFGPGTGFLPSNTGITALYVSTGANETEVNAIVSGN